MNIKLSILFFLLILISCKKDEEPEPLPEPEFNEQVAKSGIIGTWWHASTTRKGYDIGGKETFSSHNDDTPIYVSFAEKTFDVENTDFDGEERYQKLIPYSITTNTNKVMISWVFPADYTFEFEIEFINAKEMKWKSEFIDKDYHLNPDSTYRSVVTEMFKRQ